MIENIGSVNSIKLKFAQDSDSSGESESDEDNIMKKGERQVESSGLMPAEGMLEESKETFL